MLDSTGLSNKAFSSGLIQVSLEPAFKSQLPRAFLVHFSSVLYVGLYVIVKPSLCAICEYAFRCLEWACYSLFPVLLGFSSAAVMHNFLTFWSGALLI